MAQQRRRISIRTRIAVVLGVVAVALPIAGGVAVATVMRDGMRERALAGEVATAAVVAGQAERSIRLAVDLLQQGAARPGLSAWVASKEADRQRGVLENLHRIDLYRSLATYDRDGSLMASVSEAPTVPDGHRWDARSYVGTPRVVGSDSVITVREPVVFEGRLVGHLVGDVALRQVVFGASPLRFGETGALALVTRDGSVLLTGDPERRNTKLRTPELLQLTRGADVGTASYRSVALRREEVGAYVPVDGTTWGVLATQAAAEVFAGVDDLERALWVGGLLVLLLGSAITVLVWRNVSSYEARLHEDQEALEAAARALERKNAEVEAANQSLREFVAVAAHDLRGPVAAVSGFAELLHLHGDGVSAQQRKDYAEAILRQAAVMGSIVDDLLMISRIEAGHLDADPQRVELGEALEPLAAELAARGDRFDWDGAADVAVVADARHVDRMFRNYISNAFKYGAPPVSVDTRRNGGFVEVRVSDRGAGVPREFAGRLFEKFARASKLRGDIPGTGLGLSIVRGLARLNGGDAWYEPGTPAGAVFAFRLPAADADQAPSGAPDNVPVPQPA